MSRRQATTIIALLSVIAVALVVLIAYFVGVGSGRDEARQAEPMPSTESAAPAEQEGVDPVALLEDAGVDVVMGPPVPDAPEEWGDYVLDGSWDDQVRVFEGQGVEPIRGEDGDRFPATMNGCGLQMHLVTFRAVAEPVHLEAQLVDAVGDPVASEVLNGGWMLGTNCVTPSFAFDSSTAEGGLTDVAYTVHRYRRSSVAQEGPQPQSGAPAPAAPPVPAEPTFVRCVTGLASMGIYSDGSTRPDNRCPEPHVLEGERVCGGMYGWQEVSRERYIELCGVEPPTGG